MSNEMDKKHPTNEVHIAPTLYLRLWDLLRANMVYVNVVLGVILILVIALAIFRGQKRSAGERADQMLANAQTIEQLREIVDRYPDTPAATYALLSLGANLLHAGQYPQAQFAYDQFIKNYPKNAFLPVAQIGQAYCLEAMGNVDGALAFFTDFSQKNTDSYLCPVAILGQGRCLEQQGKYDQAQSAYSNYASAHPDSRWLAQFEVAASYLDKQRRTAGK